MSYRQYNSVDLAKEWKRLINDNVVLVRDASIFKRFMADYGFTPVQILHGMYAIRGNKNITIRMFLDNYEEWIVDDPWDAELELAIDIAGKTPPLYFVYKDISREEVSYLNREAYNEACKALGEFKERVIG